MSLVEVLVLVVVVLVASVWTIIAVRRVVRRILAAVARTHARLRGTLRMFATAIRSAGISLLFGTGSSSDRPSRVERIVTSPRALRTVLATAGTSLLVGHATEEPAAQWDTPDRVGGS